MKVLVVGSASSEVAAVRNSRDLPGMAGFDHELRTLASRRQRGSAVSAALPTGKQPPMEFYFLESSYGTVLWNSPLLIGAAEIELNSIA